MGIIISRRAALKGTAASLAASLSVGWPRARAEDEIETHGLSAFGDLALPPDFKSLSYVNPNAPKGGLLALLVTVEVGNQNFDTFDTLNIFSRKGDGAAGMLATYDTLMGGNEDEPDSVYGLLARSVRYTQDKLTYRFLLRPEARFSDGSPLRAADVVFSLTTLKEKAHPYFSRLLTEVESVEAEAEDVVKVRFIKNRTRDAHLIVAGMPVFSAAWWKGRDFDAATLEAPLGSGAYKVKTFEQGRFIEFELDHDYWAKDHPLNVGGANFQRLRYEYFRERQVAFEAFKAGVVNFNEEHTSRFWANNYDFAAVKEGRVVKEIAAQRRAHRLARLVLQHPPRTVQGPARSRSDRPRLRFRMDEQERDVLVLQARRLVLPEHAAAGRRQARTRRTRAAGAPARQNSRLRYSAIPTRRRSRTGRAATGRC